ncbi:sigma-70 family RNA polymerase sigma factor [Thalassobacillus sp. CUG 92003]|uniref:sigma-70 family RNA polymerase sigma factor n=1 Tax=Thalassobacillus sp. CUG 92003 TaxID=2736641 RepID=UPI0015E76BC6|nr:sigma-70 family RNA polymerase sigma factor [Thalassobacillus sp. CUG 92003]
MVQTNDKSTLNFMDYKGLAISVLKKLNAQDSWDDHLQDAYLVFLRAEQSYDRSRAKFSTHFETLLYYHFLTQFRKASHQAELLQKYGPQLLPSTAYVWQDNLLTIDILRNAHLSQREKLTTQLSLQDKSIQQIALLFNQSPSTIKRIRKNIRQKLIEAGLTNDHSWH